MSHEARRSRVPPAGNRPRYHLSRVAIGPYIARTASDQERGTLVIEEIAGTVVKRILRTVTALQAADYIYLPQRAFDY